MKSVITGLYTIILYVLGLILLYGIILYVVFRYNSPENLQPFEMATVTALLGGFALAGGFSGVARLKDLTFSLRRIGALYIASTIAFFLFGLFIPLTEETLPKILTDQAVPIAVASVYIGAFLLVIATGWILWVIPRVFKEK